MLADGIELRCQDIPASVGSGVEGAAEQISGSAPPGRHRVAEGVHGNTVSSLVAVATEIGGPKLLPRRAQLRDKGVCLSTEDRVEATPPWPSW